jgi:hypothetical protein
VSEKPGAFYWSVGYQINEFNSRSTASLCALKEVEHWTPKEIQQAKLVKIIQIGL